MRREWVWTRTGALVLLVVGLAFLIASSAASAPAPVVVRVALTPLQSWGPLFLADSEGLFAKQGIKVEWVPFAGGADTVAVLIQGSLDVGAGGASAGFLNAVARGERVRIVADKGHVEPGFREIAVVARKGLKEPASSLADLRGRRIAVNTTGSILHYILARALARGGLTLSQIELVRMPFPSMLAALQQGGIDAAVLAEPFVTQAVEMGAATFMLAAGEVVPDEPIAFVFYGPNLLDKSPDVGRRFMVAYLQGLREYVQGPTPRNVRVIATYAGVEADVIRKGGWFPISRDGSVNINAIRRFQDWLYEQQFIAVRSPASSLVDATFLMHAATVLQGR